MRNRNKLIKSFIGNMSNVIVHEILEKAIDKKEIADKYRKELITSFEIAKRYREKINPINISFPYKDVFYIKNQIINKVNSELRIRISKGYKNINLELIKEKVDKILKEMIIE